MHQRQVAEEIVGDGRALGVGRFGQGTSHGDLPPPAPLNRPQAREKAYHLSSWAQDALAQIDFWYSCQLTMY